MPCCAAGGGGRGRARSSGSAREGGRLCRAHVRDRARGRCVAAVHHPAGRQDRADGGRRAAGGAVPRHHEQGQAAGRHRAGPAVDGVPARLRDERQVLRLLHERTAPVPRLRRARERVPPLGHQPEHRRPGVRARAAHDPSPGSDQPQRRPAPVRPGRRPLHLDRRWRRRQRHPATPRRRTRCWARSCASTPARARRYSIPAGNPFGARCAGGSNGGDLPEIWAYGLRNPWRFSFDRPRATS